MSDLPIILARLADIDRIKFDLDSEREELLVAKRVLERLGQKQLATNMVREFVRDAKKRVVSLKRLFVQILESSPTPWLTSNEIRERASNIKGADVPMSSVSPTLTDLKKDRIIVRDGLKVALASRVLGNNEASARTEASKELRRLKPSSDKRFATAV